MNRALVMVESTEFSRQLVREAGELAAGVDADLKLLATMEQDEYEHDLETMSTIADVEGTAYSPADVKESGRQFARDIARTELEDVDVEYDPLCIVVDDGKKAQRIVALAEEHDCDHIFIAGQKRSPTGKAIFGDTAQRVILNFNGAVTVVTD
ncbi:universal stress protein [Natronorubrum texcoconense]|uniref:Nucleotide-binding universal stress protein, UspA family n=1 Tax=Natronorubrum texcoconense TaxID=1095776 RepID=A0A1G9CSI9_9EURY|nr:universal stress protein [Natronorubrum texcoconense]SDK54626.1 Nucleotide-binding universal stress protein, UspA family [Natronorubrum texcoconense]